MYEPLCTYLTLTDSILRLNEYERWCLIKQVEHMYESEADSPLGEFLEEYVWLLLENGGTDMFHQDLQDLIDAADLNEEMLKTVGNSILTLCM